MDRQIIHFHHPLPSDPDALHRWWHAVAEVADSMSGDPLVNDHDENHLRGHFIDLLDCIAAAIAQSQASRN